MESICVQISSNLNNFCEICGNNILNFTFFLKNFEKFQEIVTKNATDPTKIMEMTLNFQKVRVQVLALLDKNFVQFQ